MSKVPKRGVSQLAVALDKGSGFSCTTKTRLTLVEANLIMYHGPNIQRLGTISAFIDQRLLEMVKPTNYADWRVTRFQGFVDNQDGRIGWNAQEICRELGLGISGSRLARLFRRCLGVTLREYAKRKRLWVAAQRLKNPTLSVKEIASELGYHMAWDFQRQFKQLFGLTPTEFRKLCEKEVDSGDNEALSQKDPSDPAWKKRQPLLGGKSKFGGSVTEASGLKWPFT
jgi:AraC-like DNA-binding protein